MKIKILKPTMAAKKPVDFGDLVDVEDKDGRYLISIGYAELAKEKASKAEKKEKQSSPEKEEKE
jgi:hypothetical protein